MDKLQINTNGKGKGPVEIPETSSRWVSSQFQPSSPQFPPDNHRLDEHQFSQWSQPTGNLQTLESSFARLSFADSNHLQNVNPILQNQSNQVIIGGHVYHDGGYELLPRRTIYEPQLGYDHLPSSSNWSDSVIGSSSNWNDSVNGSYVNPGEASSSMTHNNGFFNHNVIGSSSNSVNGSYVNPGEASSSMNHNNGFFNDYPYPSVNSFFYQRALRNGFGSGIHNYPRNNGCFGYNHDHSPSMNNENRSILTRAKHPIFSKQLQRMIPESSKEVFDTIFKDLIGHVCDLMMDASGHEVVQSLIMNCSSEQITMIVDLVTQDLPQFVHICNKPFGTRTIQLLMQCIRYCSRDQIFRIVETVSRDVYHLARNNNSQSVIVKCFEEFTFSKCWTLLDAISQSCLLIAKDQNGCIMLQTLLREFGELRQPLIPVIIDYALELCYDSYGNYLVQFLIIEMLDLHVAAHIMIQLRWNYAALSRNKYGSHVVQRLLQKRGIETTRVVLELLRHINTLVVHEYGNYVIQTAWDVSEEYMRGELWGHIQPNIPVMRCNKYGRKILERIQKSRAQSLIM